MRCWSNWSMLQILLFIYFKSTLTAGILVDENIWPRLVVAASHTALSGDLRVLIFGLPSTENVTTTLSSTSKDFEIELQNEAESTEEDSQSRDSVNPLVLRVLRLNGYTSELVGEIPAESVPYLGDNLSLTVPCGFLSRGGIYAIQLERKNSAIPVMFTDIVGMHEVQVNATLNVKWPTASLSLKQQRFETYPSQPVSAILEFTGISCPPSPGIPVTIFSLQLIYCGLSVLSCDTHNNSDVQLLYSEEIAGFPIRNIISLRCELFGQSGHYALKLKPSAANPSAPTTSAYMKVESSERFVFNVRARSVYPCDGTNGGGVTVLFEYPSCRLQGDRIRVYGRLRADVASLKPPSTLHYLAELKAPPSKHTLTFDCDIFTEKFVEYCFVYVSQAITGAMSDVRVNCIPTFPLQDGHTGGWGPWSQWTACSSSCVGGKRHRYRFCDRPPPRYGAKFCKGQAIETQSCGGTGQLDFEFSWSPGEWECRHGKDLAADKPEIAAKVGNQCRCGCLVKLEENETRKILAASTQACPGRSFWLVQTRVDYRVKLHLDQANFYCKDQYVRVRDGDSLNAELLVDVAFDRNEPSLGTVISSDTKLLIEFFSDEEAAIHSSCVGGFLAHATTFLRTFNENITTLSTAFSPPNIMAAAEKWALWLTPAHLAAATLFIFIFIGSSFLALQYALKYRKYEIAEDLDSLTDDSACSGALQGLTKRAPTLSSSTLISEVVSLVRLQKRDFSKHVRLGEASVELEDSYETKVTQSHNDKECESVGSSTLKEKESDDSSCATFTLGVTVTPVQRASTVFHGSASGQPEVKYARPVMLRTGGSITSVSEELSSTVVNRRYSATSASISLNNAFSPASTSSNSSQIRYGKESKDRRNRERLLQGPGSEFSLANQDMDLELDYYDYNVVNAGAAPGSYLGMDPAFLVWIPPFDSTESDILTPVDDNHCTETVGPLTDTIVEVDLYSEVRSEIILDSEGIALTPAEYKLMRESGNADKIDISMPDIRSECTSTRYRNELMSRKWELCKSHPHEKIIKEYTADLSENLLPGHQILDELQVGDKSSFRCTEDKMIHHDIIPNQLTIDREKSGNCSALKTNRNCPLDEQDNSKSIKGSQVHSMKKYLNNARKTDSKRVADLDNEAILTASRIKLSEEIVTNRAFSGDEPVPKMSVFRKQKATIDNTESLRNTMRINDRNSTQSDHFIFPKENAAAVHKGFKDIIHVSDLNVIREAKTTNTVNIPLRDFSRGRRDSPVRVHKPIDNRNQPSMAEGIQSPDYGVEADIKDDPQGFYDLIGEDEDVIKFADEDDDYIDNKMTA